MKLQAGEWQVNEMASIQYSKLTKQEVDKIANWWNSK
jgi:hypothetical protein